MLQEKKIFIDINNLDEFVSDEKNLIKLGCEICKEVFAFFPSKVIEINTIENKKEKIFYCCFCVYFPQLDIYLFNYKVVNINKNVIKVISVKSKLFVNYTEVEDYLLNFIEMWPEHIRVLLSPLKLLEIDNNKNINMNITFGQWSLLYSEIETECAECLVLHGQIIDK